MAVEDNVVVGIRPPELHHDRGVVLSHSLQYTVQAFGRVYHLGRDEMVRYNTQILVGDDEWDVVAIVDNACYERVVDVVAHSVAVDTLHSCCPQLHIEFLLVVQSLGHTVGEQQRDENKDGSEYQYDDSAILQHLIFQSQKHSRTYFLSVSCEVTMR